MSEVKKFPGQPVLIQILDVIRPRILQKATRVHKANRYYKRIPVRIHLVSLLYEVFSYCNGLRELSEGMLACEGKLSHLGLDKAPARSTLSDANNKRSYLVFETIYKELLKLYHPLISDSRLKVKKCWYIVDNNQHRLGLNIPLQSIGKNATLHIHPVNQAAYTRLLDTLKLKGYKPTTLKTYTNGAVVANFKESPS